MKKPTTYDEQIQLLKSRGLIIEDEELETIEISLKSKLSYISAHKIGEEGYKDKNNFKYEKEFEIFIRKLEALFEQYQNYIDVTLLGFQKF